MPDDKWLDNAIQFPRLLAEINACGLREDQMAEIAESMGLEWKQVQELLDRADAEFARIKQEELDA